MYYAELSFVTLTIQPYNSADLSEFFKNFKKWERIVNRLNKQFCYQDRLTEKKVLPPPPPPQ